MPSIITILLGLFLSAFFLTGMMRNYAISRNLLDVPNERSSHAQATPRGGGVAIVITFLLSLSLVWASGGINIKILLAVIGAGILVAVIGFWDDHGHVPRKWRLLVHLFAAIWAVSWIMQSTNLNIASMTNGAFLLVSVFFLSWLINLFNFMDGIDGIAGSEALFIALSAGFLVWLAGSTELALIFYGLAASVLGFLIWNWPPARIFMGDVGSGFLGIVLGVLCCAAIALEFVTFWPWLILFGVFLVDASVTLIRRMLRGERWYEAHCTHAYQHAARDWGHLKVTLFINIINYLWLLPLALLAFFYPGWGWFVATLALLPLIFLALAFKAGIPRRENEHS